MSLVKVDNQLQLIVSLAFHFFVECNHHLSGENLNISSRGDANDDNIALCCVQSEKLLFWQRCQIC